MWEVQCACGKLNLCSHQELKTGKRNRCDECGKKKRFGEQQDGVSINFFHNYARGARSRGIEFLITYEYVEHYLQCSPSYYPSDQAIQLFPSKVYLR